MHELRKSYLIFGVGLLLWSIGALIVWAGLNLPGTTGHDGSPELILLVAGLGVTIVALGSAFMNIGLDRPPRYWAYKLNLACAIVGVGMIIYGLVARAGLTLGW